MGKLKNNQKGFGTMEVILVLIIVVLLGVVGWFVYKNQNKTTTTSNPTTQTSQSTTPKTVDPYVGWKSYTSKQEKSSFKYPSNWTTNTSVQSADPNGDAIQLISPTGSKLSFVSAMGGVGGYCNPDSSPHIYINKVTPQSKVPGLYVIELGRSNTVSTDIGIVGKVSSNVPKVGDVGCSYYLEFSSKHDTQVYASFASDNSQSFHEADLQTAELILNSFTY